MLTRRNFVLQSALGAVSLLSIDPFQPLDAVNIPHNQRQYPFLWGAAYYRAPSPEPECWEADFMKMQELGFNHVKFLVQWRWSHIGENKFNFDDLKQLLEVAHRHNIKVTLNHLLDVSPHWLYKKYPDAKQVMNNGRIVEPYAVGHRHIGGHPGPCYNHPGAKQERINFVKATVTALKRYPALEMWDVWNEPELSFPQRWPIDTERLVCYCKHCAAAFISYLKRKYADLQHLNKIWGRNYPDWEFVEMPRSANTFPDFIDWREFHGYTMTEEAKWRINVTKKLDPERITYLHVVPNTMNPFNAVSTCADDFEMAEWCDVFAATMNAGPYFTPQVVSAARSKIAYNVENHINGGSLAAHQRVIDLNALLRDIVPQLGLGIKGFLFWQYRSEVLGNESPAWGLVNTDGSEREVTRAVAEFWKTLKPHSAKLMECGTATPAIGIWKSRRNEIFHYCMHGNLTTLSENINGYANTLYWNNYGYRFVSAAMLEKKELTGFKVLIIPSAYYLTEKEADALYEWVEQGGIALIEAHTGGYNGTAGRHSSVMPGCGLAEKLGIKETLTTASVHLKIGDAELFKENVSSDLQKLLEGVGTTGSKFYPITQKEGGVLWGAVRYAELSGINTTPEAWFMHDKPVAVSKKTGKGWIYYYGSNLGTGTIKDAQGLVEVLEKVCNKAGVEKILNAKLKTNQKCRVDVLHRKNVVEYLTIQSNANEEVTLSLKPEHNFKGLFSGINLKSGTDSEINLPAMFADIFVKA
jgi:beta-galactosidase